MDSDRIEKLEKLGFHWTWKSSASNGLGRARLLMDFSLRSLPLLCMPRNKHSFPTKGDVRWELYSEPSSVF
jgi:hypothetical protein